MGLYGDFPLKFSNFQQYCDHYQDTYQDTVEP